MTSLLRRAIDSEKTRRQEQGVAKLLPLLRTLSEGQGKLIRDEARFKLARASRQSGKTHTGAAYMVYQAIRQANSRILFVGLTRDAAKEAVWDTLLTILDTLDIQYEARPSALRITFPNGSFIRLFGADTPNAKNRLRGQRFHLVIIDEGGFYQQLDGLMPAIMPTLATTRGTLAMLSSPGILLSGFFYDADQGDQKHLWSRYTWKLSDNPIMQRPANDPKYANRAEEELDTICKTLYNGNRNHPAFVREYLGEWVRDNTSLIYPFDEKNIIAAPYSMRGEMYGIGVDLGVTSASAIVIMKYSEYDRHVQIVDSWKASEVLIDDFADILKSFMENYKTSLVVADTGGLGAAIVQELRKRYSLPIRAAEKTDKAFHQRIFSNDLISGYIQIPQSSPILTEWARIVKDESGEEVKGQENHLADATLYIYRYIYQTYLKSYTKPETEEERMIRGITDQALREKAEAEDEAFYDY